MHLYRNERVRAELRKRDYAAGLCLRCDQRSLCDRQPQHAGMDAAQSGALCIRRRRRPDRHVRIRRLRSPGAGTGNHSGNPAERPAGSTSPRARASRSAPKRLGRGNRGSRGQTHGGGNRRLADRSGESGRLRRRCRRLGIQLHDGQEVVERARAIKSRDEIDCLRSAIAVCENGLAASARCAASRRHRKPIAGHAQRREHRRRRRIHRNQASHGGSAHEPLVPGIERASRRRRANCWPSIPT